MAEHLPAGRAELGAPMDYAEHERTYEGFLALASVSAVSTLNALVALVLYAFGGGWGFWLGNLMILLTIIGAGVGMASRGSMKPPVIVFLIGVVLVVLTTG
jgi:uncharacterized membrane protein YfcA